MAHNCFCRVDANGHIVDRVAHKSIVMYQLRLRVERIFNRQERAPCFCIVRQAEAVRIETTDEVHAIFGVSTVLTLFLAVLSIAEVGHTVTDAPVPDGQPLRRLRSQAF